MKTILALAVLSGTLLFSSVSYADTSDKISAVLTPKAITVGCAMAIGDLKDNPNTLEIGICIGEVDFAVHTLSDAKYICQPKDTSLAENIDVVLTYILDQKDIDNQSFDSLAIKALTKKYRCTNL